MPRSTHKCLNIYYPSDKSTFLRMNGISSGISDVAFASVYSEKTSLKKLMMKIIIIIIFFEYIVRSECFSR